VVAAKDVAGKKPLYYAETEDGVLFSSELKAIARNFFNAPRLNYEVLRQVQAQRYSITNTATFINEISKAPPGHVIVCKDGKLVECRPYHHRRVIADFEGSYGEAVSHTRDLLVAAVEKRLESEMPMGILLSAGIDSSAIACIAARLGRRLTAFSAGYRHYTGTDESHEAERLAHEFNLPFQRITLNMDSFVEELPAIMAVIDEPNADPAMFPQWALLKAIHGEGYKVLLSGLGGDEVFFGYPAKNVGDSHNAWEQPSRADKVASFAKTIGSGDLRATNELLRFLIRKSIRGRGLFKKSVLGAVSEAARSQDASALTMSDMIDPGLPTVIDRTYSVLLRTYLPNNGYFLADKLGMAHSIEVRCPFADKDLRAFIDSLPLEYKLPRQQAKGLLKDALRGLVPGYILDRHKTGFTPPSNYVQGVIERHQPQFFCEPMQTLAQVITDSLCAAYTER